MMCAVTLNTLRLNPCTFRCKKKRAACQQADGSLQEQLLLLFMNYSLSYSLESFTRWLYLSSAFFAAFANSSSARSGKNLASEL